VQKGDALSERVQGAGEPATGLVAATVGVLGHAARSRLQGGLLGFTLLLGILGVVGVMAGAHPADGTFVLLSKSVQSPMSVTLPFIGVLMARDVLRSAGRVRPAPMWLAATILAAATGLFGVIVCAVALLVAPADDAAGRWNHALSVAVCGVLVQVVAQLVGTGLGLLLRPVVLACLATIVLPIGLWLVLGSAPVLRPIQAWTTPYATVQNLLSGRMTVLAWVQWSVVVLLWAVVLNAVGAVRLERS
jgi:hypothetical protein